MTKTNPKPHLQPLKEFYIRLNEIQSAKENLMFRSSRHEIVPFYYHSWLKEANGYFRLCVLLKRRLEK